MKTSKTLQECLEKIEDPRASHAIEHKLIDILMISILAVLCNADTWNDIASFRLLIQNNFMKCL